MKGGIRLTGKVDPILNPVSWTKKETVVRHHINVSDRRSVMAANLALAEAAARHRGEKFAIVGGIPRIAAEVASELAGKSYGGLSGQERRQAQYAKADATIARLRASLSRGGGMAETGAF